MMKSCKPNNPQKKSKERYQRAIPKVETQKTNRHMKSRSNSLVTIAMQMKTIKYHFTHIKLARKLQAWEITMLQRQPMEAPGQGEVVGRRARCSPSGNALVLLSPIKSDAGSASVLKVMAMGVDCRGLWMGRRLDV